MLDGTVVKVLAKELKNNNNNKYKFQWIRDGKLVFENTLKSHNYNQKIFCINRKNIEFSVRDMVYV